ncbi:AEC family transporter [Oceanibium sediminis]|uniref:AEC family transporter n=1 Tax=Oceanibium sediminis TaxID=2026339 RepID=UPI000DD36CDD|nr:AEC family transporter [Oceanibium sediminis]
MIALLQVVIPVFLVCGAGYLLTRTRYLSDPHIDGLNRYTQGFAIPCLLFSAALNLDFGAVFDPRLLGAFYAGNTTAFLIGMLGARFLFGRRPGEAVAVGFGALFSNSVILGVPIVERAFGGEALQATFAIVAIHAPFCYFLGITVMEFARADGRGLLGTGRAVINAMLHNALMIGLLLGIGANLGGVSLPAVLADALDLVVRSALPAALVGLGGVLTRYRLRSSLGEALMVSFLSLVVHPGITFVLAHHVFDLPVPFVQGAVLTAAMAPGVNAYVFAALYNRAMGAAASSVLLATGLSVFSVSVWLSILNTTLG